MIILRKKERKIILHPNPATAGWNSTDDSGKPVSSGVYFYKLDTDKYSSVKKMVLMK